MKEDQDPMDETRAISPLLSDCPLNMPFQLPERYFETLPGQMLEWVRMQGEASETREEKAREEIDRISPLLASAFGLNPFKATSPDSPSLPLSPANGPVEGEKPVVHLPKNRKTAWISYAAAAAATGVIAFFALRHAGDRSIGLTSDAGKVESLQTHSPHASPPDEDALTAYLNEQVDPLLITAEATDTMMMKAALVILDPGLEGEGGLFDDVPTKELYAFIDQVPDLSGLRPDME